MNKAREYYLHPFGWFSMDDVYEFSKKYDGLIVGYDSSMSCFTVTDLNNSDRTAEAIEEFTKQELDYKDKGLPALTKKVANGLIYQDFRAMVDINDFYVKVDEHIEFVEEKFRTTINRDAIEKKVIGLMFSVYTKGKSYPKLTDETIKRLDKKDESLWMHFDDGYANAIKEITEKAKQDKVSL